MTKKEVENQIITEIHDNEDSHYASSRKFLTMVDKLMNTDWTTKRVAIPRIIYKRMAGNPDDKDLPKTIRYRKMIDLYPEDGA